MASARAADIALVHLDIVSPAGPSLAYHVGWIVDGALYVHGGIDKLASKSPSPNVYRFDFADCTWSKLHTSAGPTLSHHACVVVSGRYAVTIGGWTGRERTSDVYVFDVMTSSWCSPRTMGFPVGGGLSSHAAVMLASGDVLVAGREGSLRMQRKFGSVYLLRGDPAAGTSAVFQYTQLTISTASRSGHSLHIARSTLMVLGGRADTMLETHAVDRGREDCESESIKLLSHNVVKLTPAKAVTASKHHASVYSCGLVFLHGGWTFDGKSRDPVGQMYALQVKTSKWVYLGESGVCRAGHVCCYDGSRVILHGGEGPRATVHGTLYQLRV